MNEPVFVINGADYPIPDLDSFSIDECRIYHEWTGTHVEEIDETPVTSMTLAAFMQIAYMRGNPGVKPHLARDMVGASNFVEALERFNAANAEDDASPPEQRASETRQSGSPGNNDESQSNSGEGSTTPSGTPASGRSPGGSPDSEPSATFRSLTSAA